ncbi:claudin domain-containing protein 2-like isoform X2 [Pituophis catenifer annectens]|uniref:claudin domain-containing protein 2-like isoform X2 n=1 Tax=Pituophis catenifer annectens TaxID=94852 RepID=UPI00399296F5
MGRRCKAVIHARGYPIPSQTSWPVHPIEMSGLCFFAVLSNLSSFICLFVALSSDYWVVDSRIHMGLFRGCNHKECLDLNDKSAVYSFMILFIVLALFAGVVSLGGLCCMCNTSWFTYKASFTAGLCIMITMSIATRLQSHATVEYGWGYHFGWAAFPFYLLTGCLTYKLHKNRKNSIREI